MVRALRTSMRTAEGSVGHGGGLESREFLQLASIGTRRICYRICHGTKGGKVVRASLNAKSGHFFGIGEFSRFSVGSLASCNANSTHVASKMLNFQRGCEQEGVHRLKETQIFHMFSPRHPIFAVGASKTRSIASTSPHVFAKAPNFRRGCEQ